MNSSSERRIKHYSNFHQILLVGEGDFSFSSALANAFGSAENMVSTSLDSREKVVLSYESGQNNLQNLERRGAMTLHGVDVTKMDNLENIRERKFDRIVFNFPHAGFFGKEDDQKVIKTHSHLVGMFFKNARQILSRMGEIHVTHKEYYPYKEWKLVEQAEKHGLLSKESVEFKKEDYCGYTNRRGAGSNIGETFTLGNCRTYMFIQSQSIATESLSPKSYCKVYRESLEEVTWELEFERRARKAAEIANFNLEASFNHLKFFSDTAIKEKNEFKRQRDDALHQRNEALREKTILAEVLRLKDISLVEAGLVIEFERQAKSDLATSLNHFKAFAGEALREMGDFKRQRDVAFRQKDEALRQKEDIAKQLAEASSLKEAAIKPEDVSIKEALLELEFQRQVRKPAETAKADSEASFEHFNLSVCKERKKMNRNARKRGKAKMKAKNAEENQSLEASFLQKKEVCREKEKGAKQSDGTVKLQKHANKKREKILRKQNDQIRSQRELEVDSEILCSILSFD